MQYSREEKSSHLLTVPSQICPRHSVNLYEKSKFSDFINRREIGRGSHAIIYKATCVKTMREVAIKANFKKLLRRMDFHRIKREIAIIKMLQHENIVAWLGNFEDADCIYLVQEWASRGDLFEELRNCGGCMPEGRIVREVLVPLVRALQHMHGHGVIHRDLKPENIVLAKDRSIKVCDFGLAINKRQERPVSRLGTLQYMAPEVVSRPYIRPADESVLEAYDENVDVWACGILIYELVTGRPPFDVEEDTVTTTTQIMRVELKDFPEKFSSLCKDFVKRILKKESSDRLSLENMLRHPFVTLHARPEQLMRLRQTASLVPPAVIPLPSIAFLERQTDFASQKGPVSSSGGKAGKIVPVDFDVDDLPLEASTVASGIDTRPKLTKTFSHEPRVIQDQRATLSKTCKSGGSASDDSKGDLLHGIDAASPVTLPAVKKASERLQNARCIDIPMLLEEVGQSEAIVAAKEGSQEQLLYPHRSMQKFADIVEAQSELIIRYNLPRPVQEGMRGFTEIPSLLSPPVAVDMSSHTSQLDTYLKDAPSRRLSVTPITPPSSQVLPAVATLGAQVSSSEEISHLSSNPWILTDISLSAGMGSPYSRPLPALANSPLFVLADSAAGSLQADGIIGGEPSTTGRTADEKVLASLNENVRFAVLEEDLSVSATGYPKNCTATHDAAAYEQESSVSSYIQSHVPVTSRTISGRHSFQQARRESQLMQNGSLIVNKQATETLFEVPEATAATIPERVVMGPKPFSPLLDGMDDEEGYDKFEASCGEYLVQLKQGNPSTRMNMIGGKVLVPWLKRLFHA